MGSAALAASIAVSATPARAQFVSPTLICCCDVDFVTCVESPVMQGQSSPSGTFCPPPGDANAAYTEVKGPVARGTSGYNSCSEMANPAGAEQKAAAKEKARTRSWLKLAIGTELIPDECRTGPQTKDQPCTLRHLLQVVVNITRLMLGVMGSLALLMFVYGGFVFITSAGNTERVSRGKTILTNAVFGILILLVSWSAVNLVVVAFSQGRSGLGDIGQIFGQPWNKGP